MEISNSEKNELTLDSLIDSLPDFCRDFFIGTSTVNTPRTQIRYAYSLKMFFDYLKDVVGTNYLTLEYLDSLTPKDIEEYLFYTTTYVDSNGKVRNNQASTKSNKLSALRSFYKYLYAHDMVKNNPAILVNTPKIRKKELTTLSPDEVGRILNKISTGNGLSKKQLSFAEKTRYRDYAIFVLLLTSGMRVSELVGINMSDINFEACEIKILRKGLKEQIIYMSDEAEKALKDYIEYERGFLVGNQKDLKALFISLKHQRLSVRAVESMVKKFTSDVTVKNISPHKLRTTFGNTLYNETGDLYLTATALGHESVNTTSKYYSRVNRERVRAARNIVKINEE